MEFLGVKEVTAKGTLKDSVVGRIIWDPKARLKCKDQVSKVYSGPGEIHPLKDSLNKNIDAVAMVQREDSGQYAGFHLQTHKPFSLSLIHI